VSIRVSSEDNDNVGENDGRESLANIHLIQAWQSPLQGKESDTKSILVNQRKENS
jgi:hypothetical protein